MRPLRCAGEQPPSLALFLPALGALIITTQNPRQQGKTFSSARRREPTSERAQYISHVLHTFLTTDKPAKPLQFVGPDDIAEDIPLEIYSALREVFQQLMEGQAISLIPDDTLLTTQQGTYILNISRPTLYRLLDEGEIPFVSVGTHRRLRLADVEALRERCCSESRKALNTIASLNEERDDYGDDYGRTTRE
jgi:excisionase family DNA binding protein